MKLSKTLILPAILIGMLLFSACAPTATVQPEAPTPPPAAAAPVEAEPAEEAEVEAEPVTTELETIVLYSNAVSDGRGEWIQERAASELGIDVQIVGDGGVVIANRLISEKNNPMADVVFGLNPILWAAMERENIIVPHTPPWAAEVPAHLHSENGLFHAVILVGNLLTYDTAQITPEEAPTDWLDLWQDSRFHQRYAIPNNLGGSTIQMVLSGIFARYLDPTGHLGVSDEGWAQIEGKFLHGVVTDQDMYAEIVNPDNDVAMSQMWSHGIPVREEQHGLKMGIVVPEVGVPFSIEGVALINGATNPEAAKRFIDWFGTAEVMHEFSAQFGFLPAHPEALEGLGGMTQFVAGLKHQEIDWDIISNNIGGWMEHIYLVYMQ